MIQTIAISVGLSVLISTVISVFMQVKSAKAISVECTKYISRNQNNK